jgi:hypothetical protein
MRLHIHRSFDDGALRTLWAYFYDNIDLLEHCLLHYYLDWFENDAWTCRNPSAALVWSVRNFVA